MDQNPRPKVGVATAIFKEGGKKILIGKRIGSLGNGTWALPGGHLEFHEEFETCSRREVLEETGLELDKCEVDYILNDISIPNYHYVVIILKANLKDENQEPKLMEPDKCSEWRWINFPDFPTPIFPALNQLLKSGWSPKPF